MPQYQTFPGARGHSNSSAKLQALRLPALVGKAFLDVGCNEGFFVGCALAGGASRAVGLDYDANSVARAKARFPAAEFHHQSWDDPIEGTYDVILLASAIHYANDQPALIGKLMKLLNPDGVLVLELGVSPESGSEYVRVERTVGDVRWFATVGALRKVLAGYSYREMGDSVMQGGDQIPRQVLHVRNLTPTIVFFDAPSMSGKSTLVKLLTQGRERVPKDIRTVSLDGIFARTSAAGSAKFDRHRTVIAAIEAFKAETSPRADLLFRMLREQDLVPDFLAFLDDFFNLESVSLVLWDGYVADDIKTLVRAHYEGKGWNTWETAPRRNHQFKRLDTEKVIAALEAMTFDLPPLPPTRNAARLEAQAPTESEAGLLHRCVVRSDGVGFAGWAVDFEAKGPAEHMVVGIGNKVFKAAVVKHINRFQPASPLDWQRGMTLGFRIRLSMRRIIGQSVAGVPPQLSATGLADVRVGVKSATGKLRWLPRASDFEFTWA